MPKIIPPIFLATLALTLVTACGSSLMAQPEPAETPVNETAKEIAIVQPESPLAPPTATAEPAEQKTPPLISTPLPIYSPTPAPSPTPTPTFEPLSEKPILGYVFKPPEEIPSTRKITGIEIVDWKPGSSEELLLRGVYDLAVLNVSTGEVDIYGSVKEPGNIRFPVWVPESQSVAYFSSDIEAGQSNLWLGQPGGKTSLLLTDVSPPLIPIGQGVAVYDQNAKSMQSVAANGQELSSTPAAFDQLSVTKSAADRYTARRTAVQPDGDWVAVTLHNSNGVLLLNSKTGEEQLIELGGVVAAPFWALNAKWSPDGQKLALIVTQGIPPVQFSALYVLDWPAGNLQEIENAFQFIKDIAWAPDSKQLLIQPVIDQKDGFNILALYITDLSKPSEILPIPIPIDGLSSGSNDGGLSWSPDGKRILVKYSDNSGAALYQIDVASQ